MPAPTRPSRSRTRCGRGGDTSPIRRCGRTRGSSSRCTARHYRGVDRRQRCWRGSSTPGPFGRSNRRVLRPAAKEAAAYARLGVAVTRGLLLDLLATADRAAVDAAMDEWIALSVARMPRWADRRQLRERRGLIEQLEQGTCPPRDGVTRTLMTIGRPQTASSHRSRADNMRAKRAANTFRTS